MTTSIKSSQTTSRPTSPAPETAEAAHRPEPGQRPRLKLIHGEAAQQLTLPYEYEVAPGVPAIPPATSHLHLVAENGSTSDPDAAVPPHLEHPGRWTQRLARAIAEVATGERPAGQLTGHVSREVQTYLALRGQSVARHPASRGTRGATRLRAVQGVRVCPVAPGVVEASAVLVGGDRARALALRLEAQGDQWVATAVQLG